VQAGDVAAALGKPDEGSRGEGAFGIAVKGVHEGKQCVYIPNSFMGLKAVEILRKYILDMRMLSGSYLLASPKSPSMFVENMERLPAGVYLEKPGGGRFSTTTRIQRTWTRCAGRQRTR
jgi:hypothetical protein